MRARINDGRRLSVTAAPDNEQEIGFEKVGKSDGGDEEAATGDCSAPGRL